jgi:hypothetical protein
VYVLCLPSKIDTSIFIYYESASVAHILDEALAHSMALLARAILEFIGSRVRLLKLAPKLQDGKLNVD